MKRTGYKETGLRSVSILMDVRNTAIYTTAEGYQVPLSEYCRALGDERSVERIHEAVQMLVEARKDPRKQAQVEGRKEALGISFEQAMRKSGVGAFSGMKAVDIAVAVEALDHAIRESIHDRTQRLDTLSR